MTLDVAFLGYRFMGRAHANAIARLPMFFPDAPDINRHTLIGRDEEELAAAQDRLGFSHTATEWEPVLDEVDVLYNLAPNYLHAEPSITALEQNVHVFCEKPLAATRDQADAMDAAARDSDAVTGVAFNYRFVPAVQKAKQLIDTGEIGDIYHVRGQYLQDWLADSDAAWSWRNDEQLAGSGALGDLGSHTFDLARYLFGDINTVTGRLETFVDERPADDEVKPVTVDDAYTAEAVFENGATGVFSASRVASGHKNDLTIEVNGSDGSLRWSLERLNELAYSDDHGYQTMLVTEDGDPYIDHWWPPGHVLGWEHPFVHENYEFLTAAADEAHYVPDFGDGYTVQRYLDAVEESDRTGKTVPV